MFHSWFLCTSLELTDLNVQEYLTRFYLSMQPTPNPGIGNRTVAEDFSASIRDDVACEGSFNQHRLSSVTPGSDYAPHSEPTMPGSVGFLPASSIRDGNFSNDAHPYSPFEMAFDLPVPPALHSIPLPLPIQRREERGLQGRPHRSQRNVAASFKQPAVMRKNIERSFWCYTCRKGFTRRPGLNRHHRETHNPSLCILCGFEWGRPYQYRDHLKTHHPEVNPDNVIGKSAKTRCRAASSAGRPRPKQVLPPTIEYYGRGHADIRPYRPMQPSVKPETAIPPAMSSMTYIPQSESAQLKLTKSSPEGAVDLIV